MDISSIKPINKNMIAFYKQRQLDNKIKTDSGFELYKDTRFEPTFSIKDKAVAFAVSDKICVPEGADVYLSYTVCADGAAPLAIKDEGNYYPAKESDAFMWEKDGEIGVVGHWVIVEPTIIEEKVTTKSGILIPNEEKIGTEYYGKVRYINETTSKNTGIKQGDKVRLKSNAHYRFKFHDEELYRVDSNLSILGIER